MKLKFEEAIGELEDIIKKLENGQTPLEDSIKLYEHGNNLIKYCHERLKAAENKIEKLELSNTGKPVAKESF